MAEENTKGEAVDIQETDSNRLQVYKQRFANWYVKCILRRKEPWPLSAQLEQLKHPRTLWQSLWAQTSPRWLGIALGITGILILAHQGLHWFWQLFLIVLIGFVLPKLLYRFNQQFAEEDEDIVKSYPGQHLIGKIITLEEDVLAGSSSLELENNTWLLKGADGKVGDIMQVIAVSGETLYLAPTDNAQDKKG